MTVKKDTAAFECRKCSHFLVKEKAKIGLCRRYPLATRVHFTNLCGEFKSK